jgi:hypothetical protein
VQLHFKAATLQKLRALLRRAASRTEAVRLRKIDVPVHIVAVSIAHRRKFRFDFDRAVSCVILNTDE